MAHSLDTGRNPVYDEHWPWFYRNLDQQALAGSKSIPSYTGPGGLFKPPRIEKNLPRRFYLSGQLGGTGKGIAVSKKDGLF